MRMAIVYLYYKNYTVNIEVLSEYIQKWLYLYQTFVRIFYYVGVKFNKKHGGNI
jgi:hypothetical protein